MKKIAEDLKSRQFERVYLLYGNEEYLKQNYSKELQKAIAGDDEMNLMKRTGSDTALETLRDFTDTMPFFAEKRLLLLEDTGYFKNASEGVAEWLESLPDTAVVVFTEKEADKRNRCFKKVSEVGHAAEMNHPDEESLGKWVLQMIKKRELKITREAYQKLLAGLPEDMESVKNEVTKLCDFAESTGSITPETVEAITVPKVQAKIFEMVEAVARGDRTASLKGYYELLENRESPLLILYLIGRELNQLLLIRDFGRNRTSNEEIAARLKLRPGIVGKLSRIAQRFSYRELQEGVREALDLETRVKSGNLQERMAVELLIFKMTEKEW